MIRYNEQGHDEPVRITEFQAIVKQKEVAASYGHVYNNDSEALEDFLTVHWGWQEEDEKDTPE